ncbi:tyrosine-type recombinase/integrase [Nonomuraea longispora]|uniref:tyrosine-type recombinase/integrase n=1 Tax=Nonomuraea longispora TaxID=1848320 RepID=UPI00140525F7|nr:tyrosine-type recombinase/integrase [Nonomuraea longispora]
MTGNGFKRCKCRQDGRELGAKCPRLRRKDGSWNPNHGTWYGKEEVPAGPDGKRVYLRLGGFKTETDLIAFYEKAGRLLEVPEAGPEGHEARMEILDMIRAAHKKEAPLPDFNELRRRYNGGQQLGSMLFGWEFEEGEPKTEASDGVIALDTGTVAVLKEHRARQNEERLEWGEDWTHTGRIFTHEDGTELHPAWVSELFSQLAYQAGLPPIRLHDLRHCAATLAYAAGADTKMVSSMLRHSSTNLTENTYTTVLPELAHTAAEASAAIVPRAVSQTGGLPSVSQEASGGPADSGGEVKPLVRRMKSGRAPGARTRNLRIKSP